jgi:hypothetical protein
MPRYKTFFARINQSVSSVQIGDRIIAGTAVVTWVLQSVKIVSNSLGVSSLQAIGETKTGAGRNGLFVKHFASHLGAYVVKKSSLVEQATHFGTDKKQIVLQQQQAGKTFSQPAFYL